MIGFETMARSMSTARESVLLALLKSVFLVNGCESAQDLCPVASSSYNIKTLFYCTVIDVFCLCCYTFITSISCVH